MLDTYLSQTKILELIAKQSISYTNDITLQTSCCFKPGTIEVIPVVEFYFLHHYIVSMIILEYKIKLYTKALYHITYKSYRHPSIKPVSLDIEDPQIIDNLSKELIRRYEYMLETKILSS